MKKIIIVFAAVGIIAVLATFTVYRTNRDFADLKGEIMLMQDDAFLFPLIIYDPNNNSKREFRNVFYDVQYDPDNADNLIAIIDKNDRQQIYKIVEYQKTNFADRQVLYTGKNVRYPKFVPGKKAISFIEDCRLTYYDLDTKKATIIAEISLTQHDWLDSDTLLFTDGSYDKKINIMAYKVSDGKSYIFKENAAHPALSYNRNFLAYQKGQLKNIVYIENINETDHKTVEVDTSYLSPFKPSPDGKYLIATMINEWHGADVIIINTDNNKIRKILPNTLPAVIDWKE